MAGLSDADANQAVIKRSDDATEILAQATDWLLSNYRDDPDAPGADAISDLMLMGDVCDGWQMARVAMITAEKSASTIDRNQQYSLRTCSRRHQIFNSSERFTCSITT